MVTSLCTSSGRVEAMGLQRCMVSYSWCTWRDRKGPRGVGLLVSEVHTDFTRVGRGQLGGDRVKHYPDFLSWHRFIKTGT